MIPVPDCRPADDAQIELLHIGAERAPLIRIDGTTTRPEELVRYAADAGDFAPVTENLYPGCRAPMPLDFVRAMVTRLDPLIRRVYALRDVRLTHAECFFSIVTTAPERLKPFQTVPHVDTRDPLHFATVHYLCTKEFGGTAFFRQDATGFEEITTDRESVWDLTRNRLLNASAPVAYPSAATAGYTQIAAVPAIFDRLILYRSNSLHSGIIDPRVEHPADPRRGRLTATMSFAIGLNKFWAAGPAGMAAQNFDRQRIRS